MSEKTKAAVGYILGAAHRRQLTAGIAGGMDSRGQVASFKETLIATVGKVRELRGVRLPKADANDIAMGVAQLLTERGYSPESIKAKKSAALKLATCAPLLVEAFERKDCSKIRDTLADVLRFATKLRANEYNVDKAARAFRKGSGAGGKGKNVAGSIAMHIKSILSMKGRNAATSPAAKGSLIRWAKKYGINIGSSKGETSDE